MHLVNAAQIARLLGLAISLAGTGCAGRLFYYPDHRVYQTPDQNGLRYEEVSFTSRDGTPLTGWFVPAVKKPIGTVIHFHGNAQNMTAHFSYVDWLPAEGFQVFTFDYRGYGRSGGAPTRRGLYEDCLSALDYIKSRPDVDTNRLVVLGQSLGGANALYALGKNPQAGVKAVAIDSTFYSYRSITRDVIDGIPLLRWLRWPLSLMVIGNDHSPGPVINQISPTPLLLIHGTADRVIPYRHAEALFAAAREPKQLWTIENGQHTDALVTHGDLYRRRLLDFYREALEQHP